MKCQCSSVKGNHFFWHFALISQNSALNSFQLFNRSPLPNAHTQAHHLFMLSVPISNHPEICFSLPTSAPPPNCTIKGPKYCSFPLCLILLLSLWQNLLHFPQTKGVCRNAFLNPWKVADLLRKRLSIDPKLI